MTRRCPERLKGTRNTTSRAERIAKANEHALRDRRQFRQDEAMQLAETWVRQSLKRPAQKEQSVWDEIADHLWI